MTHDWAVSAPWCAKNPIDHWLQHGDCYWFRHYPDFDDKTTYWELLGRVSFGDDVDFNNDNGDQNDITPIGFTIEGLGRHRFVSNVEPEAGSPEACRRANPAPTSTAIAPPALAANALLPQTTFAATAVDPGDVLTYTATGLPPGLTMQPNGSIGGTATIPGTYNVTVTAKDSQNQITVQTFQWIITNPPPTLAPITNRTDPSGTAIVPVTYPAVDPGDTVTYSHTGLPPGLALNTSTGQITGTPTTAGVNNVTLTVTDSASQTAQQTFTWTIT